MTAKQQKAFDFIKANGPVLAKQIVKAANISSESSFTSHFVPALKQHGVKHRPGAGYYVDTK